MDKSCIICHSTGKYKCPTCLVYYCSAPCCKNHRDNGCKVIVIPPEAISDGAEIDGPSSDADKRTALKFPSADTVPFEKLELLNDSVKVKELLSNPHLEEILTTINKANDPSKIMEMAMQEPLFLEFAEVCLQTVASNPQE